jgi:hypothetical protein
MFQDKANQTNDRISPFFLKKQGGETYQSWIIALSGVGWWRKSAASQKHQAMGNFWFREKNLFDLSFNFEKLNY